LLFRGNFKPLVKPLVGVKTPETPNITPAKNIYFCSDGARKVKMCMRKNKKRNKTKKNE